MTSDVTSGQLRPATATDADAVLALWIELWTSIADPGEAVTAAWVEAARAWFGVAVGQPAQARIPVIEVGGHLVGTAVGSLERGVPNPFCPSGRNVWLVNVIVRPEFRRRGYGAALVDDITRWARSVGADRVDLGATPDGQRLYERLGFTLARAPRMKLALPSA